MFSAACVCIDGSQNNQQLLRGAPKNNVENEKPAQQHKFVHK
jgi:hypothetical protein